MAWIKPLFFTFTIHTFACSKKKADPVFSSFNSVTVFPKTAFTVFIFVCTCWNSLQDGKWLHNTPLWCLNEKCPTETQLIEDMSPLVVLFGLLKEPLGGISLAWGCASLGIGFESFWPLSFSGSFLVLSVCGWRCELLALVPANCFHASPTIKDSLKERAKINS